jgi:Flp pilus assembly protein TadB
MSFLAESTLTSVVIMPTITLATDEMHPEQLSAVMAESLALEHVRVFRKLLVVRCGVIALGIAVTGLILGLRHSFGYWFSMIIFLAAPACTWIVERRRERQLGRRLERFSGTTDVVAIVPRKKVVKSS